jgi:prepilin-type N-terminal cleavage/methylation domain-containing protein
MTRTRSRYTRRRGFTLIELLVVIAIIAILVSLTAAAVMRVLGKIPEIQTRTDISQMDVALGSFMADYNLQNPPPSYLHLCENGTQYYNASGQVLPQYVSTVNFLQQWFGRSFNPKGSYDWNGSGKIDAPYQLEGEQCLVFYLGGIPTYSGATIGMTGFCPNVANPALFAAAGSTRKGPYFNFNPSRLTTLLYPGKSNIQLHFPVYTDAWQVQAEQNNLGSQPYAFFSTSGKINGYNLVTGGDCPTIGAEAYYESITNKQPGYTFNNRYQIISAGQDGIFGFDPTKTIPGGVPWSPANGATGNGKDDQANFSSKILGAGQQ